LRRAAAKCAHGARTLGFERYEQRLALSGNVGLEPVEADQFLMLTHESGAIRVAFSGATISPYNVGRNHELFGNFRNHFMMSDAAALSLNPYSTGSPTELFENFGHFEADGKSAASDLLATNSEIVPIPPPATEPQGNEGGQIPMTAFLGPSMFGMPPADDALLAARPRSGLQPAASDGATPDSPAALPPEALRGRAVVFEVAEARQRFEQEESDELTPRLATRAIDEAPIDAQASSASESESVAQAEALHHLHGSAWRPETGEVVTHHAATSEAPSLAESLLPEPDVDQSEMHLDIAIATAAARDVALASWQEDGTILDEERDGLAATVDTHQRRMIGGALIAIAAVPVAKALRRHGQPAEQRPRHRRTGL
jgi:hypothetical protein